jgi:hypothetical protein
MDSKSIQVLPANRIIGKPLSYAMSMIALGTFSLDLIIQLESGLFEGPGSDISPSEISESVVGGIMASRTFIISRLPITDGRAMASAVRTSREVF